jgi:hypothetical protein
MPARATPALLLAALAALTLSACESTQSKSRRLETTGAGKAQLTTISAGAANPDVEVLGTTILHNRDGGRAVVVELDDEGGDQAAVPIQIVAKDAKGKPLYKNDLHGLQTSLQQMAYLRRSRRTFWVHDQVTATDVPRSVDVEVGKAKAPAPAAVPEIALRRVHLAHDQTSGTVLTGVVQNRSKVSQRNLPIYAVARRGGRIVAAGRAIIEKLDPEPQKKPTVFRIYMIGDPKGAQLDVRPVPTTFTGAAR